MLLDFSGAVQVAQLRRTRTLAGKKTVEVVYIITSMPSTEASPLQIATWVQGHWAIENRLHWVRDALYDEDRSSVRSGNAPRVMATLRSTAISILRVTGTTTIAHATRPTTADLLKHDFAGTLGTLAAYSPSRSRTRRRSSTSRLRRPGRISTPFSPLDSPSPLTSPTSAVAIAC